MDTYTDNPISRRAFIKDGTLFMLTGALSIATLSQVEATTTGKPALRIGMITDIHYADTDDRGGRNYRESLDKMIVAVDQLNQQHLHFAVHGGDMEDALPDPDAPSEARFLKRINAEFKRLKTERHYVLGNHCVYSLTKPQFLDIIERPKSFYSFDKGKYHFVVLDACYRKDGVDYGERNFDWTDTEIPAPEREWLTADLKTTTRPTIVFVHQRLDLSADPDDRVHSAPVVRGLLEQSGKVIAVFQGHSHVNDFQTINGIHYCTLDAIIGGAGQANNAYSVLEVHEGVLKLDGFCKHAKNPLTQGTTFSSSSR
jgi:alkaline phosphatase